MRAPPTRVLERLAGTLVLRTDRHGAVKLSTDGERLWVEVERAGGTFGASAASAECLELGVYDVLTSLSERLVLVRVVGVLAFAVLAGVSARRWRAT